MNYYNRIFGKNVVLPAHAEPYWGEVRVVPDDGD